MSRRLLFFLLAAAPLWAQFSQFAATDNGSQIYFISPLTLSTSTGAGTLNRLYRIGPDGVSLVATPGGVSSPQVSGDGSLIGYTMQTVCNPFGVCQSNSEAELQGAKTADLGPGTLQLSRNGRYALIVPTAFYGVQSPGVSQPPATLTDLTTNQQATIPIAGPLPNRAVASDGSVLLPTGVWKQGVTTPLPAIPALTYTPLALSDDASTVIAMGYVPGRPGSLNLIAINLASGAVTTLRPQIATQLPLFMGLSNTGRQVLYRFPGLASAGGPAYVADTATGAGTPIALPPGEQVLDGAISGDGAIAILATNLGRILQVTIATGAVNPLIPPTPYISTPSEWAIGSFTQLFTTYTADWTGAILLNGKPLPVIATKPGEVDVQVPWELGAGNYPLQINLQTGSPFQQLQSVNVTPIAPAFLQLPAGQTAIFPIDIFKGDWSGYQTTQPNPGDIVYLYMTGLGPVTGPVATGVPAPLTSVEPIQTPLTCTFTPQTTPAQTLFAGLAPGLIGIYQLAFRLPNDPNTQPLNGMQCRLGTSSTFGFGIVNVLVN